MESDNFYTYKQLLDNPSLLFELEKGCSRKWILETTWTGSTDDYPSSFSFFDILSIELQSKCYDEINPFLQDYVEDTLDDEFDNLPPLERFVLEHSECAENLECDIDAVHRKIYAAFHEMLNKHWETRKVQRFEDTRW